jgi:hypothetical protein
MESKKEIHNDILFNPTGKLWSLPNKTYNGKPCKDCGKTERYNSTKGCVYCTKLQARKDYWRNPEDIKTIKRKKYKDNPDTNKDLKLRRAYGISLEEYKNLLKKQDGVCAICEKNCSSGRMLCVDHDHKTNTVRGLLCVNCNRAIGNLKDNINLLTRMIKYLKVK